MKTIFALLLAVSFALSAQAQPLPEIGSTLSAEEIGQLATGPVIQAGNEKYRLIAGGQKVSAQAPSLLVNEQGQVGQSHHEVTITGISPEIVRTKAADWLAKALEVKSFGQMSMTVLRFSEFADAAKARNELERLLPAASVRLPIQFSQRSRR